MDENNLKTTLKHFDTFLQLCECKKWMESVDDEEIRNAFKLSNFLESFSRKIIQTSSANVFEKLFIEWLCKNNREIPAGLKYFQNANDIILRTFLKNYKLKPETVLLAIDEYLNICDRTRFEVVLQDVLLSSAKERQLYNLFSESSAKSIFLENSHLVLLNVWSGKIQCGDSESVSLTVKEMVVKPEHIITFLKLLSVDGDLGANKASVQRLVLDNFLFTMRKHSIQFWRKIISADQETTIKICEKYPEFLHEILSFLVIYAKNMLLEYVRLENGSYTHKWTVKFEDSSNLGGEEFGTIIKLLNLLSKSESVGSEVKNHMEIMKSQPNCTVWEDIEFLMGLQ